MAAAEGVLKANEQRTGKGSDGAVQSNLSGGGPKASTEKGYVKEDEIAVSGVGTVKVDEYDKVEVSLAQLAEGSGLVLDAETAQQVQVGAKLRLLFNAESGTMYTSYRWIQTVRATDENNGEPSNDPRTGGDDLPFYYNKDELAAHKDVDGYELIFWDRAYRAYPKILETTWHAELSLVGEGQKGFQILITLGWGFVAQNGKSSMLPLNVVSPSEFQRNSVPTKD